MSNETPSRRGRCPTCRAVFDDTEVPRPSFRPFCSERCKLIDLGKWLGGEHAIPGEPVLVDDDHES